MGHVQIGSLFRARSRLLERDHNSGVFQSEMVVYRLPEFLLAAEVALSCLNRCVSGRRT